MEVILLEPVSKLGKTGDKVEVKTGYARNYLIPRGVALRASKENVEFFEQKRSEIEGKNSDKLSVAEKLSKKINGVTVTIIRQAAEDGRLYGSVTVREIAQAVKEAGHEGVDSKAVDLLEPIRAVGAYRVRISLHADVKVIITVNVARSESEAEKNLAAAEAEQLGREAAEAAAAAEEAKKSA